MATCTLNFVLTPDTDPNTDHLRLVIKNPAGEVVQTEDPIPNGSTGHSIAGFPDDPTPGYTATLYAVAADGKTVDANPPVVTFTPHYVAPAVPADPPAFAVNVTP